MAAIDLYSGIGGWTLGFRMAGIEVASSYEWWKDANNTHNKNFGTTHAETNIRELRLEDLPNPNDIEFVLGSPPCTQFSYANRGGNGDIADGMIDIYKFLEVVEYLNPRYWAMENVPRVAKIIEQEIQKEGSLFRFKNLFSENGIRVYDSSDFGVPQKRKRMIAGRLPFDLLESYKEVTPRLNMGDVLDALDQDVVVDPIYGTRLNREDITDHIAEAPLSEEEARINGDSKAFHAVYNTMRFPDRWDRPSRTITALCTRVSRESIIIQDHHNNLRRLTVRERGCIQSFPLNYQYYSGSYGGKLKMIGNAVPPLLTFYIAQSMLERNADEIIFPNQVENPIIEPNEMPIIHTTDNRGANYSWSRSFWLAIPKLRFGSGVRFELRNVSNKEIKKVFWRVNFFYGNSKNIKQLPLEKRIFEIVWEYLLKNDFFGLEERVLDIIKLVNRVDIDGLQEHWSNHDRTKNSPIWLIDEIGHLASSLIEYFETLAVPQKKNLKELTEVILRNGNGKMDNKKLVDNGAIVIAGIIIGSIFNTLVTGEQIDLRVATLEQQ